MARDVPGGGEVGLAGRVQARHPAPRQGVGGRVGVDEVAQEEVGAELPRQAEREDPDGGEPHAGVVVQVALLHELPRPVVEALDARLARLGAG